MCYWLTSQSISIRDTSTSTWRDGLLRKIILSLRISTSRTMPKISSGSQFTDDQRKMISKSRQARSWYRSASFPKKLRIRHPKAPEELNRTLTRSVHHPKVESSYHLTHWPCGSRWLVLKLGGRSTWYCSASPVPSCAPWWHQWYSQTLSREFLLDEIVKLIRRVGYY